MRLTMRYFNYIMLSVSLICSILLQACGGSARKEVSDEEQISVKERKEETVESNDIIYNDDIAVDSNYSKSINQKRVTNTYISSYAVDHYDGDQQYDYLFNWEWPETFKNDREEIFGLLN